VYLQNLLADLAAATRPAQWIKLFRTFHDTSTNLASSILPPETLWHRRSGARKVKDSVEVYLDDEILGLLYIDDEDKDDISYDLNISILQQDLDDA
jgi:hypothetical protein